MVFLFSYPDGKPYLMCSDKTKGVFLLLAQAQKKKAGKVSWPDVRKPNTHANNGVDSRLKDTCSGNQNRQENAAPVGQISNTPPWEHGKTMMDEGGAGCNEVLLSAYFIPSLIWFGRWNWLALMDRESEWTVRESRSMKGWEPQAPLWKTQERFLFIRRDGRRLAGCVWTWRMACACLDKQEMSSFLRHANRKAWH